MNYKLSLLALALLALPNTLAMEEVWARADAQRALKLDRLDPWAALRNYTSEADNERARAIAGYEVLYCYSERARQENDFLRETANLLLIRWAELLRNAGIYTIEAAEIVIAGPGANPTLLGPEWRALNARKCADTDSLETLGSFFPAIFKNQKAVQISTLIEQKTIN